MPIAEIEQVCIWFVRERHLQLVRVPRGILQTDEHSSPKHLPLDPYYVDPCLGDGSKNCYGVVCNSDPEIRTWLTGICGKIECKQARWIL
jgi:hypothetical protein